MWLSRSDKEKREYIRATMRDIARQIWLLPFPRQDEVRDQLLSLLRDLETENGFLYDVPTL